MSNPIIKVNNLSKRYRIGAKEQGYKTFREAIMDGISAPVRNLAKLRRLTRFKDGQSLNCEEDVIWALKDVSFEVNEGEVLGIIGRNGAGKTTILKVLSRITEPTFGFAEIHGRISSLLEVGTGFHPELTGRENIFLNGAILGMRKHEIERKFDEIVNFAEIEKFIDTPVKRYSSGMYVRLAFAVAAHLEPEILLVDEVLAVGDNVFQKKCLGKMSDITSQGRTVLFVSHFMPSILNLCSRTLLLDGGRVHLDGSSKQVVEAYLSTGMNNMAKITWDIEEAPGGDSARIHAVRIRNHQGHISATHEISDPIILEMDFWCLKADLRLNVSFHVYNGLGICVFTTTNYHDPNWGDRPYKPGLYRASCEIPGSLLNEDHYKISCFVVVRGSNAPTARQDDVLSFQIYDNGETRGDYRGTWIGVVRPLLPWKVQFIE